MRKSITTTKAESYVVYSADSFLQEAFFFVFFYFVLSSPRALDLSDFDGERVS